MGRCCPPMGWSYQLPATPPPAQRPPLRQVRAHSPERPRQRPRNPSHHHRPSPRPVHCLDHRASLDLLSPGSRSRRQARAPARRRHRRTLRMADACRLRPMSGTPRRPRRPHRFLGRLRAPNQTPCRWDSSSRAGSRRPAVLRSSAVVDEGHASAYRASNDSSRPIRRCSPDGLHRGPDRRHARGECASEEAGDEPRSPGRRGDACHQAAHRDADWRGQDRIPGRHRALRRWRFRDGAAKIQNRPSQAE